VNGLLQAATLGLVSMTLGCGQSTVAGRSATGGASNATANGAGDEAVGGSSGGGSVGGTSAGAAGSGGSNVGHGGNSACPNVDVGDEPGIVVTIDHQTIEFRSGLLWYDGRPPTLDLSALTDAVDWVSFRIFIDPPGDVVVPGVYQSGPGNVTYVIARRWSGDYDTIDNDASTICVTEAGTGPGARVAGSFSAALESHDGSGALIATGTFSGALGAQ
jgi:hypothetical protein